MSKVELNKLSAEELQAQLLEAEQSYESLRYKHASHRVGNQSPLSNPSVLGNTRREIARIKTEIRKRELATLEASGQPVKRDKIRARRKKEKKH